jgi:hypothetical protein
MHPGLRWKSCHTFIFVLLLIVLAGPVMAAESVTVIRDQTVLVNGTWEKNMDARIPFTIDDFGGFRHMKLSYEINTPGTDTWSPCGLAFLLTTDEYLAAKKSGTGYVYVRLGEGRVVYNSGVLSFDPRAGPEAPWLEGKYVLLVNIKPDNCVTEAHIRLEKVSEAGETPATTKATPRATTPAVTQQGTPMTTAITVKETVPPPGTTQTTGEPGTPAPSPTKPPLPWSIPALAVILAIFILGGSLNRR